MGEPACNASGAIHLSPCKSRGVEGGTKSGSYAISRSFRIDLFIIQVETEWVSQFCFSIC